MSNGIVWTTSPSDLADNLDKWGEKVLAATKEAAKIISERMQEGAQQNAPWTDQTGDARAGLLTTVLLSDALVTITLYHSVYYGIFLEVCNGGKYRIIVPTILEFGPLYWSVLKAVIGA